MAGRHLRTLFHGIVILSAVLRVVIALTVNTDIDKLTYIHTYLLTYLLHGAESFSRS